jgi:hypothetical protein
MSGPSPSRPKNAEGTRPLLLSLPLDIEQPKTDLIAESPDVSFSMHYGAQRYASSKRPVSLLIRRAAVGTPFC